MSLITVHALNIDLPPQTILDIELVEEFTVRCFAYLLFTNVVIALSIVVVKMGSPYTSVPICPSVRLWY